MALSIIHGKPGEGKSYVAVCLYLLPHLAAGGHAATNIEMVPEEIDKLFLERYGRVFDRSRLQQLDGLQVSRFFEHVPAGKKGENVLVVIDEAHKYFNARDFAKNDSQFRDTFTKLTEHRHYHMDVIMLSQSVKNIDAQIVRLHNGITTLKNLRVWHFPRIPWLRIPYYDFLAVRRDGDGKTIMRRDWIKFDQSLANCYNTHAVREDDKLQGGETGKVSLAVDPVHSARIAKAKQVIKLLSLLMLLAVAALIGYKFAKMGAPAPAAAVQSSPAAKPEPRPLTSLLQNTVSTPFNQITAKGPHGPPPASGWLASPPPVDVLLTRCAMYWGGLWAVTVEMDGAPQTLRPGAWCSRGRVGSVSALVPGKLWGVVLHLDGGTKKELRVMMGAPPRPEQSPVPVPVPEPSPRPSDGGDYITTTTPT